MPRRFPIPRLVFRRSADPVGADPDRFRERILPHLDAAYSYARYLTHDPSTAEDVVQEAFLRAFRAIEGCRGNEKAWLLAIVRNCHHDWCAKNGRYEPVEEIAAEAIDGETPHSQLERSSAVTLVRSTVEALPEPFREALVLREFEDLSYRDIAEMTNVPIGTVMSRLARARQMLATLLQVHRDETGKGTMRQ